MTGDTSPSALPLLLASSSPQRRAILRQLGIPFRVVTPAYEELPLPLAAVALVETHARGKARSVERGPADGAILGVDTAVAIDGDVLGKPVDAQHAREMLERLAGREHVVVSGLTLRHDDLETTDHATTTVRFRPLSSAELDAYVAEGEWQGRAGGYAIQGRGAALVESVDGCYPNVVGLPVALLVRVLLQNFPADTIDSPAPRP
ncbi:MAG TPA: Maf family protein [Gaiellales bacterium]|jgi:septum formation protein